MRRRGDKYLVTVDLGRDELGKRVRKFATEDTQDAADARLVTMMYELQTGAYVDPDAVTLGEYLPKWLDVYAAEAVNAKTLARYREIADLHIVPALGDVRLQKLTTAQLQAYYRKAQETQALATVRQHRAIISGALRQAVLEGLLRRNPNEGTRLKTPARARQEDGSEAEMFYTPAQARKLLARLQDKRSPFYLPTLLALTLGLRRGEICALRWRDVDLRAGTALVRFSLQQVGADVARKRTKTQSGLRRVPVPPTTAAALKAQRTKLKRQRLEAGELWRENDLVWPAWNGEARKPDNLSSGFANFRRRTCKDLDLPDVPFHGLRHTYATLLASQGYSPKDIAEMMGHSRAAFTMSTYAHVMAHTRQEIGGAVEAALFG